MDIQLSIQEYVFLCSLLVISGMALGYAIKLLRNHKD